MSEQVETGDDLLSELLRPIRLTGVFHSWWRLGSPWSIEGDTESKCAVLHYVAEGDCWIEGPAGPPAHLLQGDLAIFPTGVAHRLSDRPGRPGVPLRTLLASRRPGTSDDLSIGGGGDVSRILCAGLHYDPSAASALYETLPWMLVLDAATIEREPMLREVIDLLLGYREGEGPGSQLITLRTFEMAFVLMLRPLLHEVLNRPKLLSAYRHPEISKALLIMHTRFAEAWKVDSLAREVGMSRSAFTSCFRELAGESPAMYLTTCRMAEAARLLRETNTSLNGVPEKVGYQSTVGFHLAFRKHHGVTPGEYRQRYSRQTGESPDDR
ncbi:AraC family transcriptional regulator [Saccharothrix sp. Mg75]|uniref:AraC family transcriptional regulator n=1 Tax=Saccharothrix sp. Mg75 TaxID=3445357 RepID=UPI003EEC1D13